ncbi:MAG TPA: hypothetical protein PKN33_18135 [Phycisphaerae bacterium]|nr:hypothetical protein [Phycisphaerae bacterium]
MLNSQWHGERYVEGEHKARAVEYWILASALFDDAHVVEVVFS